MNEKSHNQNPTMGERAVRAVKPWIAAEAERLGVADDSTALALVDLGLTAYTGIRSYANGVEEFLFTTFGRKKNYVCDDWSCARGGLGEEFCNDVIAEVQRFGVEGDKVTTAILYVKEALRCGLSYQDSIVINALSEVFE